MGLTLLKKKKTKKTNDNRYHNKFRIESENSEVTACL